MAVRPLPRDLTDLYLKCDAPRATLDFWCNKPAKFSVSVQTHLYDFPFAYINLCGVHKNRFIRQFGAQDPPKPEYHPHHPLDDCVHCGENSTEEN